MPKEKRKKVFYYNDEINDDFAGTSIRPCIVDEHFKYLHQSRIWNLCAFLVYYIIAFPLVWVFERVILRVRFVNKKAVKEFRDTPYFLYGNHTGWIDAFTPNLISLPRRNRIIVAADTVSIKGLKNITQMLGAVPVPTNLKGMKNFARAVDFHHQRCNITIYPEAHIWPYYTGVRPFSDVSFSYAVKHKCPVFAFFTAYTAPKGFLSHFRKANITVYVSDAFFPDEGLSDREARKDLRDKVYRFMLEKSKFSDYAVIEYIPKDQQQHSTASL
ncbi:MAG: 1-acyl-sn-glycerol-3-phosphate acyltransferase [Clostridia bacterium]|nr:1-acyl-sn-glycerol-3-phosphate acyltransferase [Clostridia bacterium]